ncbi:MAG: KTSC domain-containing protein, partial [Alphaproteobacteria bacterium]
DPRPFSFTNGMTYVQSSALEQISYDPEGHTLCATFRDSGRTYIYEDVPEEIYDSLIFSDSLGAYFNAHIRDRFPYREI